MTPITLPTAQGHITIRSGRKVELPNGRTMTLKRFRSSVYFVVRWPDSPGAQQALAELGLSLADVQALASAADEDVVLRQVLAPARERVRCARCGRVLWDAKSIRLGMGPECRKK